MAITNLTGYTWVGNNDFNSGLASTYFIDFTSNGVTYDRFEIYRYSSYYRLIYGTATVFDSDMGGWTNNAYKTIVISGGISADNVDLITSLEDNGTLTPPAGHTVTFVTNGGIAVAPLTLVEELPTPLPTTTKTGSIFVGWYYDTLLTQRAYSGDVVTANITLYAKWYANMNEFYEDNADAIREKTSEIGLIKHTDFADKIRSIQGGSPSTQAQGTFTGATIPMTYLNNSIDYEYIYNYESNSHNIDIVGLDGVATISGNGTKQVTVTFDRTSSTSSLTPFEIVCSNVFESLTFSGLFAYYGTELTSGQVLGFACLNIPRSGAPILNEHYKFVVGTTLPSFSIDTVLWNGINSTMLLNVLIGKTTVKNIASSFMAYCYAFNQPLTIPTGVTSITGSFMPYCYAFNQPLTLPNTITSIGDNFMLFCYSFNQQLTLPSGVTSISYQFMQKCYAFNQPLTLPNTVTSIGNYFMQYCYAFNQPLTIPNNVTSIREEFMAYCYAFNQQLTLPNTVTSISVGFMQNCYAFNQPLTLPNTVTSIGNKFMYNCYSLSILIYNSSIYPTDNNSLSNDSDIKNSSTVGVKIYGTNRAGLIAALPNRTSTPFRYLLNGGNL